MEASAGLAHAPGAHELAGDDPDEAAAFSLVDELVGFEEGFQVDALARRAIRGVVFDPRSTTLWIALPALRRALHDAPDRRTRSRPPTSRPREVGSAPIGARFHRGGDAPALFPRSEAFRADAMVEEADACTEAQVAAAQKLTDFRTVGTRKQLIDELNALRKSIHGKLGEIQHKHQDLGAGWADSFFRQGSGSERTTLKELDRRIGAAEMELAP